MTSDSALIARWQNLRQHIQSLGQKVSATQPVQLLAVSKYASADAMRILYQAGQLDFAENYVQQALRKMEVLADLAITWHFIGSLQSNKCVEVAQHFSWVHSLSQSKHAVLLAQARQGRQPLQVCLQINFSGDVNKYGVLPENVPQLLELILSLPALCLRGLMVLPKSGAANDFKQLTLLRDQLEAQFQIHLPVLSMGMSMDYKEAITAGATIVRIGSSLFQDK